MNCFKALLTTIMTAAVLCGLSSCEEMANTTPVEESKLEVSTTSLTIAPEGGSAVFTLTAPIIWTAAPTARWIQVSPSEGDAGTIDITVSAEENTTGETRTCSVRVSANGLASVTVDVSQETQPAPPGPTVVDVTDVKVNPDSSELKVGATIQLTATVLPENATDKTITWKSSKPEVASVTSEGLVKALAVGSAEITATAGEKVGTCVITVVASGSGFEDPEPGETWPW